MVASDCPGRSRNPPNSAQHEIQEQLDTYHMQRVDAGNGIDPEEYAEFLGEIGYLVPPVTEQVVTSKVDPEIASIAGPQLVCPVDNARFALNAAPEALRRGVRGVRVVCVCFSECTQAPFATQQEHSTRLYQPPPLKSRPETGEGSES